MTCHHTFTILFFSMIILNCSPFTMGDSDDQVARYPRNPRVVYGKDYSNIYKDRTSTESETDIMQFKDNFGPKVQERLAQVVPSPSSSSLREQYRAFKKNTYNSGDHDYSERNFDFGSTFQTNEDHSTSFEQGFPGVRDNFDSFVGFQDVGDFYDNIDSSAEKKDPESSAEGSNERAPEFENEDLSA